MGKEIVHQLQEAHRVSYRIKPRRNTPRHILIKLSKIKYKEQTIKAAREKQQVTHKGIHIRLTRDLLEETLQAIREWQGIFKMMVRKTYNQDYSSPQGSHSDLMEKLRPLQTSKS